MGVQMLFGEKVVALGGDFRQVLPAIRKRSRCAMQSLLQQSKYLLFGLFSNILIKTQYASFTCIDVETFSRRAILCPRNKDVRLINERVSINLNNVEQMSFYATDSIKNDDGVDDHDLQVNILVEFLNTLNPSGLALYKLN
ncbi:unnamed protein product [Rotaria magnacalcarata]|uniref:ATP-dependent DNA helicase n=2 Tax=Rotaria magnacalcarata TaxID=392030 RepID=A0A816LCZ9_9BILA|nr:unnamed protein product [Rotaria magnacalcarata]